VLLIMKAYEIVSADGIDALRLADRPEPSPGPGEVLVRVRASAPNYRDLMTITDPESRGIPYPRIPNSDGAGEVLAVGAGITRFQPGDRVAGTFFQRWEDGPITADAMASALGGALDGVLAEQVVLHERGLVKVPDHLTFDEAATLPCAGLTAWHALVEKGGLKAGETVLLIGTGGVSIFALQFAVLHGARPIVISSSNAKLERAHALGAWQLINYRDEPDWDRAVLERTDGVGVDHVVEVGGAGTLERSIAATRVAGHIALIGVLTGGQINPALIMRKSLRVHGIYVGSRAMFEAMNRAVAAAGLRPVIDRRFAFDQARDAYHHMRSAAHLGKIAITLDD
jgi:NADPH:quinone reductase-like Zn-dependent oxidoreductase